MINSRNMTTDAAPSFASTFLVIGDSIGLELQNSAGMGAMLDQANALSGLSGEIIIANGSTGGHKLLAETGTDRFLNFADLAEATGVTEAKAVMAAHDPIDGLVVSLGTNDLAQVEGGGSEITGYNQAKIKAGLEALITLIRAENLANGGTGGTLPVILMIPGRDLSSANKAGSGILWRAASVQVSDDDANVHLLDFYQVPIVDSVHPGQTGNYEIGWGLGRLLAKYAHSAAGVGGPPTISAISKTDSVTLAVTFSVPSGEAINQPHFPAAWRVEDATTGANLPISRLDWQTATTVNVILATGTANEMKLYAPYDLGTTDFDPLGVIRTSEGDGDNDPGFVLQSYQGVTS